MEENNLHKEENESLRKLKDPSSFVPEWRDTAFLGLIMLVQFALAGTIIAGGVGIYKSNTIAAILIITTIVLLLLGCIFRPKRDASAGYKTLLKLTSLIIVLLLTIFIGGIYGLNSVTDMVGSLFLLLLLFILTFGFFIYYFREIADHPVIIDLSKSMNHQLDDLTRNNEVLRKTAEEINYNLNITNKILHPSSLMKSGAILVGTQIEEMMKLYYEEYLKDVGRVNLDFMGTLYGAFNSNGRDSYGFLDSLKTHIEHTSNHPFQNLRFICCKKPIYLLSAKFFVLSIIHELFQKERTMPEVLKITYPYEECIMAMVAFSSTSGIRERRVLIGPSIGDTDKVFLSHHYSVGIVIKNLNDSKAEATIDRAEKYFNCFFDIENNVENWIFKNHGKEITIKNLNKIPSQEINGFFKVGEPLDRNSIGASLLFGDTTTEFNVNSIDLGEIIKFLHARIEAYESYNPLNKNE